MKMGMLTRVMTTCARVILMALTGDGSMSTNCCTELKVWYTHTHTHKAKQPSTHTPVSKIASTHTHTSTHKYKEGINGVKRLEEKC